MQGLQEPERKVVKEDNTQLQTRVSSREYLDRVVEPYRVKIGRQMMREHEELLAAISGILLASR